MGGSQSHSPANETSTNSPSTPMTSQRRGQSLSKRRASLLSLTLRSKARLSLGVERCLLNMPLA